MKIIPVLDILNGVVVHAVGGKRDRYYPVKSVLCASPDAVEVASTFMHLGFDELYIADLDAILHCYVNSLLYERIRSITGLNLMVDAGLNNLERAKNVLESGVSKLIIGTETLDNLDFVKEAVKLFGEDKVIISIDLKGRTAISKSPQIKSFSPVELAKALQRMGVTQVIVLDLTRVGMRMGVNTSVVKEILEQTKIEVLTGGGVRGIEDLEEMRSMGVSGVLVATALHNGTLSVTELRRSGFM